MVSNLIRESVVVLIIVLIFYKALQVRTVNGLILINIFGLFISLVVFMATAMASDSEQGFPPINFLFYGCLVGIAVASVCKIRSIKNFATRNIGSKIDVYSVAVFGNLPHFAKKTRFHEYVFRNVARYIRTAEVPIIIKNVL